MVQVAAAAPVLSGDRKRRADAALAAFTPADASDETALRAEFAELLPIA